MTEWLDGSHMNFFSQQNDEEDITAPPPQIQAAIKNNDIGNLLDLDWDEPAASSPIVAESPQTANPAGGSTMDDLFSLVGGSGMTSMSTSSQQQQQQQQQTQQASKDPFADLF